MDRQAVRITRPDRSSAAGIAVLKDGKRVLVEAKQRRKDAWATGERWIGSADILVVRIDPEPFKPENEPRVYMKWSTFERLVK
jgi:hypothetical protein